MELVTKDIEMLLGGASILNGIDIAVRDKEFVGVIGPNGCGKSTLLKCMYRVLKPQKGVVFFDNKPLDRISIRESACQVAVVAQHNSYDFDFEVQDVVLMGRSPRKKNLRA